MEGLGGVKRLPMVRWRVHGGRLRKSAVWWWGSPGNPPGMRRVSPRQAELYRHVVDRLSPPEVYFEALDELDDVDDDDEQLEDLAPAACHFCGAETRDGLMVFPRSGAAWPVCEPCMQAAFTRNPTRPELRYARSPN
jgi:hypothetical protein